MQPCTCNPGVLCENLVQQLHKRTVTTHAPTLPCASSRNVLQRPSAPPVPPCPRALPALAVRAPEGPCKEVRKQGGAQLSCPCRQKAAVLRPEGHRSLT